MILISGLVVPIISLLVFFFLWTAIYNLGYVTLGGFTKSEMILYYLLGTFTSMFYVDMAWFFEEEVMSGHLLQYTIKDVNPFLRRFFDMLGFQTFWILCTIVILILFVTFSGVSIQFINVLLFILFLIIATFLKVIMSSFVSLLAIKTHRVSSISSAINTIRGFLSGSWLPLTFFPLFYQEIFYYLPFQYMYYFPNMIFSGKIEPTKILLGFVVAIFWLLLLIIIFKPVYKKAIKSFEAQGG